MTNYRDTAIRVGLCLLLIAALSSATRLYKLGDWSFSGDELYTKSETESLLNKDYLDSDNIIDALPRAVPLGYALNAIFISKKGPQEFAYRLGPAIWGALAIPIIFYMASMLYGRHFGILLSLLILLSRWHLLFAQLARFYSVAFLFNSISLLALCIAIKKEDWRWGLIAGFASGFGALTHTVSVLVSCIEVLSLIILRLQSSIKLKEKWVIAFIVPSAILILLEVGLFFKFCGAGWNKGVPWRYTPVQLLMGLVSDFGWPFACLSILGFFIILLNYRKDKVRIVFAIFACTTVVLAGLAAKLTVFRQDYIFPLSLSYFALAAVAILEIGDSLKTKLKSGAWAVALVVFIFLQFPSLLSYYQDGQKFNWREAARRIENFTDQKERVFATVPGMMAYYSKLDADRIQPLFRLPEKIKEEKLRKGNIWVVVHYGRKGLSNPLRSWLDANGHRMAHIFKNRYDYYQFVIDIYKINLENLSDEAQHSFPW